MARCNFSPIWQSFRLAIDGILQNLDFFEYTFICLAKWDFFGDFYLTQRAERVGQWCSSWERKNIVKLPKHTTLHYLQQSAWCVCVCLCKQITQRAIVANCLLLWRVVAQVMPSPLCFVFKLATVWKTTRKIYFSKAILMNQSVDIIDNCYPNQFLAHIASSVGLLTNMMACH